MELNLIYNDYNKEINQSNKNKSSKMNMYELDGENNILSKTSGNFYWKYSKSLNNIINNKDMKYYNIRNLKNEIEDVNDKINDLYFSKNMNFKKVNEIKSKLKSKEKYKNQYHNIYIYNKNKERNKSNKNYFNHNYLYNNEVIDNIEDYNINYLNNKKNIEKEYNNKYTYNKNGNNRYSGANSYININKNKNFFSESLNKGNDYIKKNIKDNSALFNNIKMYNNSFKNKNVNNENKIYQKGNKNIDNNNGINFNNINIGILNNNFIFDKNNKTYSAYINKNKTKPNKVNNVDILEIDDINEENILKNNKSNYKKEDSKKKFIIETENVQNLYSKNNMSKKVNKKYNNINNKQNNINNNYFYNSNKKNIYDEKSSKYKTSLSENLYKINNQYPQKRIKSKNNNLKNSLEDENYLKNTRKNISIKNPYNIMNNGNQEILNINSEFFISNDNLNNFKEEMSLSNKKNDIDYYKKGFSTPIVKSSKKIFNLSNFEKINNNDSNSNNNAQLFISKNNYIKEGKNNNKSFTSEKELKNMKNNFNESFKNIKLRTKDLLSTYTNLLQNKIIITINEKDTNKNI